MENKRQSFVKDNYEELFSMMQALDYSLCLLENPKAALVPVEQHSLKYYDFLYYIISSRNICQKILEMNGLWQDMYNKETRKEEIERFEKRSKSSKLAQKKMREKKNQIF